MRERAGSFLYNIEESMLITRCRAIQRNERNERCIRIALRCMLISRCRGKQRNEGNERRNNSHYAALHAHFALSRYTEKQK